jgi:hypothetical protein
MNRKAIAGWVLGAVGCGLLAYVWLTPDRPAHAATANIYTMVSELGVPYVYVVNSSTGTVTSTLGTISGTGTSGNGVPLSSINGRGLSVINGTVYYTTNSSNSVFTYTISPPQNNGALFTIGAALGGLSSVAFDGTNLWIADAVTNKAYQCSLTGTVLKTITLANASGGYVGLDYFTQGGQGRLIANRGRYSNIYDVYDLNGNIITAAFITASTATQTNGIVFDGTNFLIANVANISIDTYSGAGGSTPLSSLLVTWPASDPAPPLEDVSIDYSYVPPPPVPTLTQWSLILCGILLLGAGMLLSRKPAAA